ncbi:oxidative damage protection protein [Alcanivorax sp. 1008]|uniref:oxidative damage protection protein n=1 Tax=Alcanivorax sp. 1008 TaxID=2816853 RepID=UPI001E18C84A|nr:oxidative damage protection protein [Alcanivorax sp. 1008]MCC1495817.1 oxidative damage protection protein [Alcanivorax sp. 1008]MDF1628757.1 oxidative damage protection protein [Alcanivoracaceae bacterium]
MTRMVFCRKLQQQLEGLERPPFPGPKGQEIFDNVSKQAWQEWLSQQTMLINEKRLSVMDPATKVYLDGQRERFLANQPFDQAEGYVPPEK